MDNIEVLASSFFKKKKKKGSLHTLSMQTSFLFTFPFSFFRLCDRRHRSYTFRLLHKLGKKEAVHENKPPHGSRGYFGRDWNEGFLVCHFTRRRLDKGMYKGECIQHL